jgi:phosphoribosylaminoimidazole (AIR) synthetase
MGIGLIIACTDDSAETLLEALATAGDPQATRIGRIVAGSNRVEYAGV